MDKGIQNLEQIITNVQSNVNQNELDQARALLKLIVNRFDPMVAFAALGQQFVETSKLLEKLRQEMDKSSNEPKQ